MVAMTSWGAECQQGWRKGPWTHEEDKLLSEYVKLNGEGRWSSVARCSGLNRSGKSCRLRWVNYLRPGLKRGHLTPQEEGIIIELHALWGNRWSTIARYLPGRTDNEIKNYWRTHFKKKGKLTNKQAGKTRKAQIQQQIKQQQHEQVHDTQEQEKVPDVNMQEFVHPLIDDQCLPATQEDQGNYANFKTWENSVAEDYQCGLWSGLWNLDDGDLLSPISYNYRNKLINVQNQVNEFPSFGGDSNNMVYAGGYML